MTDSANLGEVDLVILFVKALFLKQHLKKTDILLENIHM